MKIELWAIGKTSERYLDEGMAIFEKRLKNYVPVQWQIIPDVKVKTAEARVIKKEEGEKVLAKLQSDDYLVLLDENGKEFTSVELAHWMEKRLNQSPRRLIFLIGGAFGFSDAVYERAQEKISLSRLTFSHQMVRLFLMEQLYRAMTILRNEPYHNP
ncbi:MAG: 23S rRNA (pseudouridine(1915)-N(3))-methyltransferase RlmH [Saprospiraceae bacterium]|nr:23S rRNA (pseudouridine(1915)-N(3))-methyltransferase RlmH [Saprospiraceae bacterium]